MRSASVFGSDVRHMVARGLVALAIVAGCECGPTVQEGFPVFKVTPSTVDFGTVCVPDTREQQFSILNDGSVGLQILSSKVNGSAFSLVEPIPDFLGPLGEHVVTVRFDALAVDEQAGSIVIETDDPETPKRTITMGGQGSTRDRFDLWAACFRVSTAEKPESSCAGLNYRNADGSDVPAGSTRDRSLYLVNPGCAPVTVHSVEFYADPEDEFAVPAHARYFSVVSPTLPIELAPMPSDVDDPQVAPPTELVVRFSPPAGEAISPNIRMRIRTNVASFGGAGDGSREYGLLAGSVAPALLVEPSALTFYDATQGLPRIKTFSIRNTGTDTLTVNTVDLQQTGTTDYALDFEGAAPPFNLPEGTSRNIKVVYTATGTGSDRAKVVVTAAGSEPQSVELFGGADPVLEVVWSETQGGTEFPPAVDFGTYDPGPTCVIPTVTRFIKLKNAGRAALEISSITLPAADNRGGGFKLIGATPRTIEPGGSLEFSAEFKDALGLSNDGAKLEIASNDTTDAVLGGKRTIDFVSQNAPNLPPTAVIDVPPGAAVNRPLTVSGSRSFDPTVGDVLTYAWRIIPGTMNPSSSTIRLESPTSMDSKIISDGGAFPNVAADFRLELVVTDQCRQASTPTRVLVKIGQ